MAKVYRTGADGKGSSSKTRVPKLMATVKIHRKMEGFRRERDRLENAMANERQRAQQAGVPVNEAILKMMRKQIHELNEQVEEQILELEKLEGSSDDTKNA
jgi:hypothetical protein